MLEITSLLDIHFITNIAMIHFFEYILYSFFVFNYYLINCWLENVTILAYLLSFNSTRKIR